VTDVDIPALGAAVVWGGFGIAFLLGVLMSWTRFCTMGALSDGINIGDWTRMRMWLLAIGVAVLGAQGLHAGGWIDLGKSIYTGPRLLWLSSLLGGAMFGFGMVLASGCGAKTLLRIGSGSLKALVVFLVMGLFATLTLKGLFAVPRVGLLEQVALELPRGQDLPRLLAGNATWPRLALGIGIGALLIVVALRDRAVRSPANLLGGVGVGLGVVAVWSLSGHVGYVAEDPDTLQERFIATNSGRMESLSFVGPAAFTLEWLMLWSDRSRVITLGIASALGVTAGAFAWSLATRSFRWEGFRDTRDTADHLAGAALMGVGGVTALGCTIGQGITGLSTLSLGSVLAFAGFAAGALAAFRYQTWRIGAS
jgi:uncharacterized membrane protein YedE/YeeE